MNALTQFVDAQPVSLVSAEIDLQISTAKRFPRTIEGFRKNALAMATLDERVAAQCLYAVPRDGKTIEGPSARLAEILVATWGNCRAAARIIDEGREFITAQGVFLDLESNAATTKEVKRRIVDKNGRRYSLDMIQTTGNAASSIALRNAILGGIPRAIWWDIYGAAAQVVMGDVKTLAQRRGAAVDAFKPFGIVESQIFAAIGVTGRNDIGLDHLATLAGWLNAIKDGETDPEEFFKPVPKAAPAPTAPQPEPQKKLDNFAATPPAADDEALMRARVKAVCEAIGTARSRKVLNQLKRDNIAFLAKLDDDWPEGKDQITAALAAAEQSLAGDGGERAGEAPGGALGASSPARDDLEAAK